MGEERNLIYSTYKIKPANISLIEETPTTDFDFTIAHYQQWKKHLLGNASPLQQHPATPPINAVDINKINLSKDDLFSCALHFQHSESGYANGKWVIESALGTINAKSPTGCALMNVEPMVKKISPACHEQWKIITAKLSTFITPEKMNKLCSNYDEKLLKQAQRKKWVKGIILEQNYFMHLYKDIQPNSSRHLSSSGLVLEGASEDDYVLWKNNGYKLELRVPQIKEVLHIKTSTLDAADYNGGCCHTVSESLFLRGATNLN